MIDRRIKTKPGNKRSNFAWVWLLLGVVLGFSLFTFGFVFMTDRDKKFALNSLRDDIAEFARPLSQSSTLPQNSFNFDFYDELKHFNSNQLTGESVQLKTMTRIEDAPLPARTNPQEETKQITQTKDQEKHVAKLDAKAPPHRVVPATTLSVAKPVPQPATTIETEKSIRQPMGQYILQVGAFRRLVEADRLRANLLSMGLDSYIQPAKINDQIYHRVRIGPFVGKNEVDRVKELLRAQKIDAIPMSVSRS